MTAEVRTQTPAAIGGVRELLDPALHASLDRLHDADMRRIAGYQLGLWDADGVETLDGRGKAVRPALVLLAAQAVCGGSGPGLPGAVAVELVHNFSLLHDDIMDRDVERRHRPTGWVTFGEGPAILAGNAMLTAAIETLLYDDPRSAGTVPVLLDAVQRLIAGQAADLALEKDDTAELADVLAMEESKTASLLACSLALGATAAGAAPAVVDRLAEAGRLLGLGFQIVDDVLGIVGDAAATGKSASSDVRAGKRSVPVVMALRSGTEAGAELTSLLAAGAPETDEAVAHAVDLIVGTGAVDRAGDDAERYLAQALELFATTELTDQHAVQNLQDVARFLVRRNW